uniref:Uncharacterized protein n=1 Tax=Clastoptera arizonana TaxID=38151 RepID=A0A1B6DPQ0_9HEMI
MALRDLVEGECGGANSLVRLGSHFVQDRALKEEGFRYPFRPDDGFVTSDSDTLVQQFLEETLGHTTNNFRMDTLLAEMRELERGEGNMARAGPIQSPPVAQLATQLDDSCWADQYIEAGKQFKEQNHLDGIWESSPSEGGPNERADDISELGFGPKWAKEYLESHEQLNFDEPDEIAYAGILAEDFKTELNIDSSELKDVANEILDNTADDPRFTYSKFMKFMHQIGEGEVMVNDNMFALNESGEAAMTNPISERQYETNSAINSESATQSMSNEDEAARSFENEFFQEDLWSKLSSQFKKMSEEDLHPWASEFNDYSSSFKDYRFASENPMQDFPNLLEEGKKRLAAGDLPSAVLCFEAAVQNNPGDAEAWLLLGTSQAENEQDPLAIAALKKCLQLEPSNLTALMSLAVCYTNENYQQQACSALKLWLQMNPKYSDLLGQGTSASERLGDISTLMTRDLHKEVCDLYIVAARRNPLDTIDPDVQCGLGVLFNLTNEQDKAADCFKAALQVRPEDARLWNRLGATYANGERSEEAVDAYHMALQLSPGFIRARYNLGITCSHLGAHREAIEHLLMALNQQAAGRGIQGERCSTMSDTIWHTLKLLINLHDVDRREIIRDALSKRDLDFLNKEFGMNSS